MQGIEKDIKLKKIKKEVKGITLVALVVTIIVLLILAGVAIGLGIGDNGIIGGAENITERWKEAEAGEWTEEDMAKIEATGAKKAPNNSTSLPSILQFGGFVVGGSKDENATPYISNGYVKDKETGEGVTGWRLFDIDEEGRMVLISAGCTEDYSHPYGTNSAYKSEYIATGRINSNAESLDLGLGTTYLPRDFSMYENKEYGNVKAGALTKERLDEWFTKYITEGKKADTSNYYSTFIKIYKANANVVNEGKYESLLDCYEHYWLFSSSTSLDMYYMDPWGKGVNSVNNGPFGMRILITLPSDTKLSAKISTEKTVISRENEYTYNVWNIKTN